MVQAMMSPHTSMTGPLSMGLKPITRAFCITVTSVVMRVTREDVSKSSRLEKARSCTWAYSASRRPAPKPMATWAEKRA